MHQAPRSVPDDPDTHLPVQVEIYIEPDGSVTFADLAADTLPIVQALNPNQPLACDPQPVGADDGAAEGNREDQDV
jgi:hypothetical protein